MKAAFLGLCMPQADVSNSFIMGICHDHAEIIVGDIPPQQAPDRALKHRIEHEAYAQMLADLVDTPNAGVFKQSFEQYLTSQTSVARTMHIADKLDMALQALTYENRYSISLEAFLVSATEDMMQAYEAGIHPHI